MMKPTPIQELIASKWVYYCIKCDAYFEQAVRKQREDSAIKRCPGCGNRYLKLIKGIDIGHGKTIIREEKR